MHTLDLPEAVVGPFAMGGALAGPRRLGRVVRLFYKALLLLACLAMGAAFVVILLGILARQAGWDLSGLDAYAGYAIAAALFLALPETLRHGDHIRVTLLLQRLGPSARQALELWGLGSALALAAVLAFYAARLVWISFVTHDVSPAADATPLWIPQLSMALGCTGFALGFADALLAALQGRSFFAVPAQIASVE